MPSHRPSNRLPALYLAFALAAASGALAQSYTWSDVVQVVTISPDGSVVVDDTRTLSTSGDFGEAFICVRLTGRQSLTLLDGSGALGPGPSAYAYSQGCTGGTEVVVHNDVRVKERRVRFVYELRGVLDVRRDVVQWYWQILEQEHPSVRGYSLTVNAPGPMSEPYDAYVHRFGNQERPTVTLSEDRSTLRVQFDRIPDGDGVEVRYLMDPALFVEKGARDGMEEFLRAEAKDAGLQTSLQVRRSLWLVVVPLGLFLLTGLGAFRAFRRHGREPRIETMKYPFEPPTGLPPAAVTAILSQSTPSMGPAFHATIMDLMRRGYGEFATEGKKSTDFAIELDLEKPITPLLPFENDVLNYLKAAARPGAANRLSSFELKSYSQRNGATFVTKWGQSVRKWLEAQRGGPLTDPDSRKAAAKWAGRLALSALVTLALVFVFQGAPRGIAIAATVAQFIAAIVAGVTIPSWRPEIAEEVYGWQGFKRTLTDYTRMKDAPLDFFRLWDVYYCYAAALGVADKYLKTLGRAAPLAGVDEGSLIRGAAWMSAGNATSLADFSSFSRSVSSLSSALNSASASASSGGSSSGGGGGGGGGSSGGR